MLNDYAYFKVIQTFCKARWINRPLLDVIVSEYSSRSPQYYHEAILAGCILINNKETTPDYIIKEHDKLLHIIHCHEPRQPDVVYNNRIIRTKECLHNTESSHQPVTSNYIEIIAIENDFIVVCKPPGLVSHQNPNCLYYTLTKTLEPIFGSLSCTNRLDVPTSGIVIMSKTNRLHELMKEKKIQKTYVALVNGKFEDQIVDKPIKKVYGKGNVVSEDGKECLTHFKCLEYNGTYSLVECKPITGRTHQIRVHLQSVGYPIVNDKMYNGEIIEPSVIMQNEHCDEVNDGTKDINLDGICISEKARQFAYKNCEYKGNDVYKNKDSYLCLHAYKYKIDEKEYTAKMPEWTQLSK